ncbi:MAG: response regulator transcription factor [Gaiellales bacterium]
MAEPEQTISVLVVDDDAIVRDWVRQALAGTEFRIAGEAGTSAEALELLRRRRADVLLTDHWLPDDQLGTELVRVFRREGVKLPVVLMTAHPERGLNESAREVGIQASIVKSSDPSGLVSALRSVIEGRGFFDPQHPKRKEGEAPLAPRERDVIRLVAEGKTNRQVAADLGIGEETVKTLLERAYTKLGANRRADAVLEARRRGVV